MQLRHYLTFLYEMSKTGRKVAQVKFQVAQNLNYNSYVKIDLIYIN